MVFVVGGMSPGFGEEHLQQLQNFITTLVKGLPTVVVIVFIGVLLNLVVRRAVDFFSTRTSPTFAEPSKRAAKLLISLVSIILIFGAYGADLGGIWTMLSAAFALVALGFVAVWSVLSNVSCTIMILFFRPFEVGDELEFIEPVFKGTVVNLNFAYTTLRDDTGLLVQVPNNLFFQKVVKRRPGLHSQTSLVEQLHRDEVNAATPPSGEPERT